MLHFSPQYTGNTSFSSRQRIFICTKHLWSVSDWKLWFVVISTNAFRHVLHYLVTQKRVKSMYSICNATILSFLQCNKTNFRMQIVALGLLCAGRPVGRTGLIRVWPPWAPPPGGGGQCPPRFRIPGGCPPQKSWFLRTYSEHLLRTYSEHMPNF